MADFRIGPAYLLIADDIEQPAANWTNLGPTRGDVVVNMTPSVLSRARLDTVGPAPVADGIWVAPAEMTVRAPLLDSTIERLNQLLPGSVVLTSGTKKALAIRRGTARITPFALAIVPVDEYNDESWWQAPHAIWFKQVYARVGEIPVATEVSDDDDALARVVYEVTFSRAIPNLVIYGPPYIAGSRAAGMLFYLDVESSLFRDELKAGTGQQGTFSRPTLAYYFDANGNYRTAQPDELIWTKSPSGLILPVIQPAHTNEILDNSDYSAAKGVRVWQALIGNPVSWNGFNLREVIPDTNTGSHNTWHNYTGAKLANGAVICGAYIIKPLVGQTQWALGCFLTGGTTQRNLNVIIDFDGTPPTLPTETTQLKVLKAGSIPIANGYYYVYASFFIKDKEDHTAVSIRNFITDANNNTSFAGDGTTAYALIGAAGYYFNMVHPPLAPVPTNGSTVTVSQDVLSYPFSETFPSEGLTAHFELDVPIDNTNIASKMSPNYAAVGIINIVPGGIFSPFGLVLGYGKSYLAIDGIQSALNSWGGRFSESVQLSNTYEKYFMDGIEKVTDLDGRTPPFPSESELRFRVSYYTPVFLIKYVLLKGLIDPKVFI